MATPFAVLGVLRPELTSAEQAGLPEDAEVVGVLINQTARAYAVSALSSMRSHVVNDLVAKSPVTITYCDQSDCLRTFTRTGQDVPLELSTVGWNGRELLLGLDGKTYPQSSAEIPLEELKSERMTWKDWRDRHPETLVYLGDSSNGSPMPTIGGDPELPR